MPETNRLLAWLPHRTRTPEKVGGAVDSVAPQCHSELNSCSIHPLDHPQYGRNTVAQALTTITSKTNSKVGREEKASYALASHFWLMRNPFPGTPFYLIGQKGSRGHSNQSQQRAIGLHDWLKTRMIYPLNGARLLWAPCCLVPNFFFEIKALLARKLERVALEQRTNNVWRTPDSEFPVDLPPSATAYSGVLSPFCNWPTVAFNKSLPNTGNIYLFVEK